MKPSDTGPGPTDPSADGDGDAAAVTITPGIAGTSWQRLAEIMAAAPLRVRDPAALARAHAASYAAAFAWHGSRLIGAARAVSDGVFYATICDVVVDPAWQGKGVGRRLVQDLIGRLPVEKIFLTSVPGKQGFYAKLGFLRQTNAMGWYTAEARAEAIARGVLLAPDDDGSDLASPPLLAISK